MGDAARVRIGTSKRHQDDTRVLTGGFDMKSHPWDFPLFQA